MPLPTRERAIAALASALILAGLVIALLVGLAPPGWRAPRPQALVAIALRPPERERPPPVRPAPVTRAPEAPGSRGLSLAAPAPAAALPLPTIVIVPVLAPAGEAAADTGTGGNGAGGSGSGSGSGFGRGSGAGAPPAVHACQTHGHLSPGDVPDGVLPPGGSAGVGVRYVVGTDGRVSDCTVTRPSGMAAIDAVPCPLIERRFRFRPARDTTGQAVPETIEETHTWFEPERR